MQTKPFKIYRSSAGSGKTYTLAREYLKLAFKRPQYFKHILAVTFTNKATAEMKDRVIEYLDDFANGEPHAMAEELKSYLKVDDNTFRKKSKEILSNILHGYSFLSINTIDAFFQKVIRSFSREIGLQGGFQLELDQTGVLDEVIDNLMEEVGENKELTDWLIQFSERKVEDGKSWDIRKEIKNLSFEIFKERFRAIEGELVSRAGEKDFFPKVLKALRKIKASFENQMMKIGEEGLKVMKLNNLEVDDFSYKTAGVANYFYRMINGDTYEPKSRVLNALDNVEAWYNKTSKKKELITIAVENGLMQSLNEAVDYYDENYEQYESAKQVIANFYTLGILVDITRKLAEYKAENNVMLISDTTLFLKEIIAGNDSPFIYEKTGSFYNNYLIDEFQDTSDFQWSNFKPLVENSLAEGYANMVVGDIKQSIYRWRGGDWKLLLNKITADIGEGYVDNRVLDTNYRSAANVIGFNNEFFEQASKALTAQLKGKFAAIDHVPLKELLENEAEQLEVAYENVFQQVSEHKKAKPNGHVKITFLPGKIEKEEGEIGWKEEVNERLPKMIEGLQDQGVRAKDIAILVRKKNDGKDIADVLLSYKNATAAKKKYNYEVVSNDSLFVWSAASVNQIVYALRYLNNEHDQVAKTNLIYNYCRYVLGDTAIDWHELFASGRKMERYLPPMFFTKKNRLVKTSLFELTEELIRIFGLNKLVGELAYMQTFQDCILEFSTNNRNDIGSFLTWWDENKTSEKLAINVSDEKDAIRIMTIHKSKGLQFKVVIIPYLNWSVDHGNLPNTIWCDTKNTVPFNAIKYLPLRYSSRLADTIFKQDYYQEMVMAYMDNLNMLYVAFTRAEDGLYAFAKEKKAVKDPSKDTGFSQIADVVYELMTKEMSSLNKNWDSESMVFEVGDMTAIAKSKQDMEMKNLSLGAVETTHWQSKLTVKKQGVDFFTDAGKDRRSRISYGTLTHEILARVKQKNQLKQAIEAVYIEGKIGAEDKQPLLDKINNIFEIEIVNNWFTEDYVVKTEVPILPKSGELSRLDRVMIKDDTAIIVDYKTGVEKRADNKQVTDYMALLKGMGYARVEGYLLYIDSEKVLRV